MSRVASKGLALAATALTVLTSAHAGTPASRVTRDYVNATAQSDAFERLEATTALALSQNSGVRAFATQMLSAHDGSSHKLMDTVSRAGLEPPQPGISGDQSAFLAALQSARGTAFDRLYARHQALVHRAALATQQGYTAQGDVPALKALATSTAAMVRDHTASADQLVASLGSE
jgi:putative membrane protein